MKKVDTSKESANKQYDKTRKVDTLKFAKKLSRTDIEKLIMQVCLNDYKKMEYVARTIGKSDVYLKNKIFPQMLKDGKLEKKFPFTHNHPEQAYKTNKEYAEKL